MQKIEIEAEGPKRLAYVRKVFRQNSAKAIRDICIVLDKAKRQGLQVSEMFEGPERGISGDLWVSYTYESDDTNPLAGGTVYTHYGASWTITEQSKNASIRISMGLWHCKGKNWWNNGVVIYKPTITAPEVEAQIKAWLVQIFSEQK